MHLLAPLRRRRRLRTLRCLVLALAACSLAPAAGALEPGDKAPSFRMPALAGGQVSLDAYRGKVVYLDFWASWCAPCAEALPALDRLRREFPPDDFQVLAVNLDEDPALARIFVERRPIGYPSALDPKGELPKRFGLRTMPTSFLIDRSGIVRHVHEGFREGDVSALRSRIRELVAADR